MTIHVEINPPCVNYQQWRALLSDQSIPFLVEIAKRSFV
jgi:hypothetical protein